MCRGGVRQVDAERIDEDAVHVEPVDTSTDLSSIPRARNAGGSAVNVDVLNRRAGQSGNGNADGQTDC